MVNLWRQQLSLAHQSKMRSAIFRSGFLPSRKIAGSGRLRSFFAGSAEPICWNSKGSIAPACNFGEVARWITSTSKNHSSTADETVPSPHPVAGIGGPNPVSERTLKVLQNPFYTKPTEVTTADGRTMVAFRKGYHPKLKPRLIKRRLRNCRTYIGTEKSIRGSPFRLNMLCQFAARLPVEEALLQLTFQKKIKAPLVKKVIARTSNLASIRDCLPRSALEVAECFATRATPIKTIKIHGRGKFGRMEHRFAHMRVVIREIDFPMKIYLARSMRDKAYWYKLQKRAERETAAKLAQREEEERLERENARKTELQKSKR